MNIFNWAQDNNITWIENIRFWILDKFGSKVYQKIAGGNSLTPKRAEMICRKMFNHIGFHWGMCEICRLIGFGDDGEDWYYITKDSRGKVVWNSMIGGFCTLKGRIPNWDYRNLESSHSLNGCPPEKEFLSIYEPTKFSFENFPLEVE